MNIYLDIDGVIIGTKSPQKDVVKLIKYILKQYPTSTYWLATHCRGEVNRTTEWLIQNGFPEKLAKKMGELIKPTCWEVMKTEGIDMDQDFVWFDDSLFATEKKTLEEHYVLDSFYRMNPKDPKSAKLALKHLKGLRQRKNRTIYDCINYWFVF